MSFQNFSNNIATEKKKKKNKQKPNCVGCIKCSIMKRKYNIRKYLTIKSFQPATKHRKENLKHISR